MTTRQALLRVDSEGKLHNCAVCGFSVELVRGVEENLSDSVLMCGCCSAKVYPPNYALVDGYTLRNWKRRFLAGFKFFTVETGT